VAAASADPAGSPPKLRVQFLSTILSMEYSMMNGKRSKPVNMDKLTNGREGKDMPCGPPPIEYSYCESSCQHECTVNKAIIDAEIGSTTVEERYYDGFMPVLGCPDCNQETLHSVGD
jgi:hypothetical protein